jgi:hypothetical protein
MAAASGTLTAATDHNYNILTRDMTKPPWFAGWEVPTSQGWLLGNEPIMFDG